MGALDKFVPIGAGSKQSFYVCLKDGMVYEKGKKEYEVNEENDVLEVGTGVATTGPFKTSTGIAKFRGAIQYSVN